MQYNGSNNNDLYYNIEWGGSGDQSLFPEPKIATLIDLLTIHSNYNTNPDVVEEIDWQLRAKIRHLLGHCSSLAQ